MAHTLYLTQKNIYLDAFGAGDGSLNLILSQLINTRITVSFPPVIAVGGEDMVVHKQERFTNQLLRDVYALMDANEDFFNGLRIWAEMPAGTLDAEVPIGIPAKFREHLDENGDPTGVVKKNREFYGIFYEKLGLPDLILMQYSPDGDSLLPSYNYNTDGSENAVKAKSQWQFYVILIDDFNIINMLTYEAGQAKVSDYIDEPVP